MATQWVETATAGWSRLAVVPPVEPMPARLTRTMPEGDYVFEPKWDGFWCLRGAAPRQKRWRRPDRRRDPQPDAGHDRPGRRRAVAGRLGRRNRWRRGQAWDLAYEPARRAMIKIKRKRTADCASDIWEGDRFRHNRGDRVATLAGWTPDPKSGLIQKSRRMSRI